MHVETKKYLIETLGKSNLFLNHSIYIFSVFSKNQNNSFFPHNNSFTKILIFFVENVNV